MANFFEPDSPRNAGDEGTAGRSGRWSMGMREHGGVEAETADCPRPACGLRQCRGHLAAPDRRAARCGLGCKGVANGTGIHGQNNLRCALWDEVKAGTKRKQQGPFGFGFIVRTRAGTDMNGSKPPPRITLRCKENWFCGRRAGRGTQTTGKRSEKLDNEGTQQDRLTK